jgi:hypothetical protein
MSLYYILVGYIGAELTVRLSYDSIHIAHKYGRKITERTYRKIDQYSFSKAKMKECVKNRNKDVRSGGNNIAKNDNLEPQECWISIRKFIIKHFRQFRMYITKIYKWEDDFRFTTIVISTYTITFIFLLHLTFTFIFLYTTETTNYITYIKHIVERILKIGMSIENFI